jgi:zinc protease
LFAIKKKLTPPKKKTQFRLGQTLMLFAWGLCLSTGTFAETTAEEKLTTSPLSQLTHEFTLENGLKLVVRENHRAPVVIFQIWYRVGSADEPVYQTGLSHVLEHMMFKGTQKVPTGQSSKLIAEYGGEENAFTAHDYTVYYQYWDASRLPISFELEADRMQNLIFPEEEFKKEMKVVMEERRLRVDDSPDGTAYERFASVAYTSNPQHNPVIGWMHDLEKLTLEEAKRWYQLWYAPNNATIVVVGDVNPEETLALAKRYFGQIPAKTLPRRDVPREVVSLGERRLSVQVNSKLPTLYMGFNVPSLVTAKDPLDAYALELILSVLDGGFSARFETQLIRRQKIAASIGSSYSAFDRGDTLFMIRGLPNQTYTTAQLENAIWQIIDQLKNEPISPDEMERVKAQLISERVYKMDTIQGQATELGALTSVGLDWRLSENLIDQIKTITPEQVQKIAQKYFTKERLTVAEITPKPPSTTENTASTSNR